MNFIQRKLTKKQILDNIDEGRNIVAEMRKCLIPAQNINWCHRLESREYFDNVDHFAELQTSIPDFCRYVYEFVDIYQINKKLCLTYSKLTSYSEHYFITQLLSVKSNLSSLISQIKDINEYGTSKELIKTARLLNKALEVLDENVAKIQNINKAEHVEQKSTF